MSTTFLTITNIIIILITLGVNALGARGYFNDMGQKDVSDKYKTLITPKGFAFAIWGVIYSLLFVTLIYYFVKRNDPIVAEIINLTSILFIVSSIFNIFWIISFSYEKLGLSTFFIFGILISLMTIIARIANFQNHFSTLLAGSAFTLYASWVFIATILNVSVYLVSIKWDRFKISESNWTIFVLIAAIVLVSLYLIIYKNALFPIAITWAFFGIYSSYKDQTTTPQKASSIKNVLLVGIAIFIISSSIIFIQNGFSIFS